MKLTNILVIILTASLFFACSGENDFGTSVSMSAPASLDINIGSNSSTKSYGNEQSSEEKAMKNVEVTITGTGGFTLSKSFDTLAERSSVNIGKNEGLLIGGTYKITVRVKGDNKTATYPAVNLKDETAGNFTMAGEETITLDVVANSKTIYVYRTVARIDVESLGFAIENTEIEAFEVTGIYLSDVASTATAQPKHISSNEPSEFLQGTGSGNDFYAPLKSTSIPQYQITRTVSATELGQFYVLPNTGSRKTNLIVEGNLVYKSGTKVRTSYSSEINEPTGENGKTGIAGNTIYDISATIKGLGNTESEELLIKVTCAEWIDQPLDPEYH